MPRDLLDIVVKYAAPDDNELIIRWLCKGNKYYEEGNLHRLVGICSARIIVKDHKNLECVCNEHDLTEENILSDDAPCICIEYKQRKQRTLGVGGGGHTRRYSVRKIIKFLHNQKSNRPLNLDRRYRNVKNLIRADVQKFCKEERDQWCRSIIELLE